MNKRRAIPMYVITDDCASCGTCIDECASGAISEVDGTYVIDPDACSECGACADACGVEAIVVK
jgi:ferredoxin